MAARKHLSHPDIVRQRIQTSQIVNRLTGHVLGTVEMQQSQVTAALGLLKKSIPDLSAVAHSGPDGGALTVQVVRYTDKP